ncbi:MAG: glycosyltransferase family 39 protein [Deltaproteobacteria bacterium]|nr:glycosyltransferase family 39 protein [Deltaproteobacteria bacterium]
MNEIDYIRWIKNLSGYDYLVNCVANHHGFIAPQLIKYWLLIMPEGNTDFYARLLSIIIFTLLIVILMNVRYEEMDTKTRLLAVFFISINGLYIAFSRNARLLPLFALLIFCSSIYLYRNIKNHKITTSIILFIISTLSLLTHPLSSLFLISIVLSSIVVFKFSRNTFIGLVPILLSFILVLPYYIWLISYGKVESELFPLNFKKVINWILYLFDDIGTLITLFVLLVITNNINKVSENIKSCLNNIMFSYILLNLIIGLAILIIISLFIPLTRSYYIFPLVVFSSILLGFVLSGLPSKTIALIVTTLSIKGVISYPILENQLYSFWPSYGFERNILQSFRESPQYRDIDLSKSEFINLPIYHTRTFDYYKQGEEKYFPQIDKFGSVEEIINSEYFTKIKDEKNFYLIIWDDCNKLKDPYQRKVCLINLDVINRQFSMHQIWEYNFTPKKKVVKIYILVKNKTNEHEELD